MIDEILPTVKKVANILLRDWESEPVDLILPIEYNWDRIEHFLATLTEVDLEGLATGELSASNRIVSMYLEEGEYTMNAMAEVFEQYIGTRTSH